MIEHEHARTTQAQIDSMRVELEQALKGRPARPARFRKQFSTFAFVLVVLCLLGHLGKVVYERANGNLPSLYGYYLLKVGSGSMEPTLQVGQTIAIKRAKSPDNLAVGDIIAFADEKYGTVTHRIVQVRTDDMGRTAYVTKGDYEGAAPDAQLRYPEQIYGVYVFTLPW